MEVKSWEVETNVQRHEGNEFSLRHFPPKVKLFQVNDKQISQKVGTDKHGQSGIDVTGINKMLDDSSCEDFIIENRMLATYTFKDFLDDEVLNYNFHKLSSLKMSSPVVHEIGPVIQVQKNKLKTSPDKDHHQERSVIWFDREKRKWVRPKCVKNNDLTTQQQRAFKNDNMAVNPLKFENCVRFSTIVVNKGVAIDHDIVNSEVANGTKIAAAGHITDNQTDLNEKTTLHKLDLKDKRLGHQRKIGSSSVADVNDSCMLSWLPECQRLSGRRGVESRLLLLSPVVVVDCRPDGAGELNEQNNHVLTKNPEGSVRKRKMAETAQHDLYVPPVKKYKRRLKQFTDAKLEAKNEITMDSPKIDMTMDSPKHELTIDSPNIEITIDSREVMDDGHIQLRYKNPINYFPSRFIKTFKVLHKEEPEKSRNFKSSSEIKSSIDLKDVKVVQPNFDRELSRFQSHDNEKDLRNKCLFDRLEKIKAGSSGERGNGLNNFKRQATKSTDVLNNPKTKIEKSDRSLRIRVKVDYNRINIDRFSVAGNKNMKENLSEQKVEDEKMTTPSGAVAGIAGQGDSSETLLYDKIKEKVAPANINGNEGDETDGSNEIVEKVHGRKRDLFKILQENKDVGSKVKALKVGNLNNNDVQQIVTGTDDKGDNFVLKLRSRSHVNNTSKTICKPSAAHLSDVQHALTDSVIKDSLHENKNNSREKEKGEITVIDEPQNLLNNDKLPLKGIEADRKMGKIDTAIESLSKNILSENANCEDNDIESFDMSTTRDDCSFNFENKPGKDSETVTGREDNSLQSNTASEDVKFENTTVGNQSVPLPLSEMRMSVQSSKVSILDSLKKKSLRKRTAINYFPQRKLQNKSRSKAEGKDENDNERKWEIVCSENICQPTTYVASKIELNKTDNETAPDCYSKDTFDQELTSEDSFDKDLLLKGTKDNDIDLTDTNGIISQEQFSETQFSVNEWDTSGDLEMNDDKQLKKKNVCAAVVGDIIDEEQEETDKNDAMEECVSEHGENTETCSYKEVFTSLDADENDEEEFGEYKLRVGTKQQISIKGNTSTESDDPSTLKKHLQLGSVVWGKFRKNIWWPAVVIDGRLVKQGTRPGWVWLFWLSDKRLSHVRQDNVEPFACSYMARTIKNGSKRMRTGIVRALKICATRANIDTSQYSSIMDWGAARDGFQVNSDHCDPDPDSPLPDSVLKDLGLGENTDMSELLLELDWELSSKSCSQGNDNHDTKYSFDIGILNITEQSKGDIQDKAGEDERKLHTEQQSNVGIEDFMVKKKRSSEVNVADVINFKQQQKQDKNEEMRKDRSHDQRILRKFSKETPRTSLEEVIQGFEETNIDDGIRQLADVYGHAGKSQGNEVNSFDKEPLHLGTVVWGRFSKSRWWPAVIIDGRMVKQKTKSGCVWLFWLSDKQVSQVRECYVESFTHKYMDRTKNANKHMAIGIRRALEICSLRAKVDTSQFDCIEEWGTSKDGFLEMARVNSNQFLPDRESPIADTILEDLGVIERQHTTAVSQLPPPGVAEWTGCGKRTVCIERRTDSNVDENSEGVVRCLACDISHEKKYAHPLFEGWICRKCRVCLQSNLYAIDGDGYNMFCALCGEGGQMYLCDSQECGKAYCFQCVDRHTSMATSQLIKDTKRWNCFLCTVYTESTHGRLKPRPDWSLQLVKFFQIGSIPLCDDLKYMLSGHQRKLRVLSLFDGIGTGKVALDELGLDVEVYYASEVSKDAMLVTQYHHSVPQLGDAWNLDKEKLEQLCPIDLVLGGPPCNDLSIVNPLRKGFNGTGILLIQYINILKSIEAICKGTNHVFWLLENTGSMITEFKQIIINLLGMEPAVWDAKYFSGQRRARNFWGNIPGLYSTPEFCRQLEPQKKDLDHALIANCNRKALIPEMRTVTTKANSLTVHNGREGLPVVMDGKEDGIWITELERLFGFPTHYTDVGHLTHERRRKLIGKAWSVPVIKHLLSPLKQYFKVTDGQV